MPIPNSEADDNLADNTIAINNVTENAVCVNGRGLQIDEVGLDFLDEDCTEIAVQQYAYHQSG